MADDATAEERRPKSRSRLTMTLALVVGVAVVEGIGFYTVTKVFGGGPQVAYGEGESEGHVLDGEQPSATRKTAEVELLSKFRVPNDKRGRLYIYDFDVAMKVPGHRAEEAAKLVKERQSEVSDRIAQIVRAADPAVLHEPALKTLRMQIQHAVGEIAGDQDIIVEVLIPRCVPMRSD